MKYLYLVLLILSFVPANIVEFSPDLTKTLSISSIAKGGTYTIKVGLPGDFSPHTQKYAAITNTISIAINDSVVVADKPAAFANTIEAKGTYRGHEVHFFSVYNNGIMGIFGAGWETTVLVDNDLAARFKL